MNVRIEAAGESAFIVYLGERTSPEVSAAVQAAADSVREALGDLLIDLVPSYASLLVIFDVLRSSPVDARTRGDHGLGRGAVADAAGRFYHDDRHDSFAH